MEYRLLGASGLEVSVLSFGTMTLGGEGRFAAMGNVQTEEARRQIEICIEAGVNLFDTADIYSFGKSEEVLGQALGARPPSSVHSLVSDDLLIDDADAMAVGGAQSIAAGHDLYRGSEIKCLKHLGLSSALSTPLRVGPLAR